MKLQFVPRREQAPSSVFLEHYASLRAWALRLTNGEQAEAEDVLHDSFVQFIRLAPELSRIENIGGWHNARLNPETVMHRSFDYMDYPEGGSHDQKRARHLRVEIWSNLGYRRTVRKLFDASGRTLAVTLNALTSKPTLDTAWEYVPDAESFRLLSSLNPVTVGQTGERIRLFTPEASLVPDRENFHPLQQNFHVMDREISLSEVSSELTSLTFSPLHDERASLSSPVSNGCGNLLRRDVFQLVK